MQKTVLELYYYPDATCGIKARLALFEKGVEFEPRVLNRYELSRADYLAINPKGVVPTLVHDGQVLTESTVICLYIDDAFEGPQLRPKTALDRARMHAWLKRIDERYFIAIGSTTFGLALRKQILKDYPGEELLESYFQSLQIEATRERRRSIVRLGNDAPEVRDGVAVMAAMVEALDRALESSEFAAGPDYSLADACLTPFVMRLQVLGLDFLWSRRPRISKWWSAIQSRDSYRRLIKESFSRAYFQRMLGLVGDVKAEIHEMLAD